MSFENFGQEDNGVALAMDLKNEKKNKIMVLEELKIGDLFVMATAKGRNNAQTFKVASNPYFSPYDGVDMVDVRVMRKGTISHKPTNSKVIKVDSWLSPFPQNQTKK